MPDVWTPGVDRATGILVTSSNWNELLGADGSLNFLGTTHDHSGDAGDGATLANKAVLGAGIYALGQKQGAGADLLYLQSVVVAIAEADGVEHNQVIAFAFPFPTACLGVVVGLMVNTGGGPVSRGRSFTKDNVTVVYTSAVAGNHHVIAIGY